MSSRPRSLSALLCLLALTFAAAAQGNTLEVGAGHTYSKVQDAITAAGAGDTVLVHPGTYKETLNFAGKAITVTSEDPGNQNTVDATILDGNQKGTVVTFGSSETASSVLTGFTIRNGLGRYGGGIYVYGASPTISHNTLIDNEARYASGDLASGQGGGILCYQANSPVISSNTITENVATYWGGGICMYEAAGTITGNTIFGNQASSGWGGGILLTGDSNPTISSNAINVNLAAIDGGGLWTGAGSSPVVSGNTFDGNQTQSGNGGGLAITDGTPTVTGNTIKNNTTSQYGGGIGIGGAATPTISGNIISDNTTGNSGNSGGGIACQGTSQSTITGNTIRHNAARFDGGGIYCLNAQITVRGNVIEGNACNLHGAAIRCEGSAHATIEADTIYYNAATLAGGGIYISVPASATVTNCILWNNYTDDLFGATATYSCIKDNDAGTGNIHTDPLFASPGYISGSAWVPGDYHLKSARGRWNPAGNGGAGGWVNDAVFSPCIDAANPGASYSNEPLPNGGRRNMGAYGDTAQASKSNADNPPSAPTNPVPANGATNQPRATTLSWTASTDPDGDPVTYDVYFGKGSLPGTPAATGLSDTTYNPGVLDADATYYWKVVARDGYGGSTPSQNWHFGTANAPPTIPSGPHPADGAANQLHNVQLSWTASTDPDGDPVTYDVYFGKDSLPGGTASSGQSAASFNPGPLEPEATYHWKVVAHDPHGASTSGPEWTFTTKANTAPTAPSGPMPANGAANQYRNVGLSWTASTDADGDPVTYDLYIGAGSLPGSPTTMGLTSAAFAPGILDADTAYHWKVVAKDPFGGSTPGAEWTFTTGDNSAPSAPSSPSPANGAGNQAVDLDLGWAACTDPDGDPVTYDVYFGKDSLPGAVTAGGLTTNAYSPPPLAPNATYHWRIVAKDDRGAQTPGPEWTFSTGGDHAAPSVVITYPAADTGAIGDDPLTVTGTAADSSQIDGIWVNGVRATPLSGNYATWQAVIPVNQGWTADDPGAANTIVAAALDEHGNYSGSAATRAAVCVGEHGLVAAGSLKTQRAGVLVPGDVDTLTLQAAAGTALKLSVKGGKGGPPCTLQIYDTYGLLLAQQSGASIALSPTLAQSGLYTVRLLPAGAGSGAYTLGISGKPPAVKLRTSGSLASGGDSQDVPFTAQAGSLVNISVSSTLFNPALAVLDPAGAPLALSGYTQSGGKAAVKGLLLPDTGKPYQAGQYVVRVTSDNGGSGAFALLAAAKAPKPASLKLLDAQLLGTSAKTGVAPGAQLQLKVAGAGATAGANSVHLGDRTLTPSSISIKGGKGSLYVAVPADMPAGEATVYFVAAGERSQPLTVQVTP
jgi:parallel beta-helix repeat protein